MTTEEIKYLKNWKKYLEGVSVKTEDEEKGRKEILRQITNMQEKYDNE